MSYKNHYLANVILRVDFVAEEQKIRQELSQEVKNICVKHFPITETKTVETQEVIVSNYPDSPSSTIVNRQLATEWHFFGINREKHLAITSSLMFIDFYKYSNFSDFKTQFYDILTELVLIYPSIKINRMGLRYIDKITFKEKGSNKSWGEFWSNYINNKLLQGLFFSMDDTALSRQMNSIEMNYGSYMLRFQYGIHNEDYPAPNKKATFILDTDIYCNGLFVPEELYPYLDLFHTKAKDWFEDSIKQKLRDKMGNSNSVRS